MLGQSWLMLDNYITISRLGGSPGGGRIPLSGQRTPYMWWRNCPDDSQLPRRCVARVWHVGTRFVRTLREKKEPEKLGFCPVTG